LGKKKSQKEENPAGQGKKSAPPLAQGLDLPLKYAKYCSLKCARALPTSRTHYTQKRHKLLAGMTINVDANLHRNNQNILLTFSYQSSIHCETES